MLYTAAGRSAASRLGDVFHLDDFSAQQARDYLVCRGLTDDSVINATIDMTGRRIKLMNEVAGVLTTTGQSLEGTFCTALPHASQALRHPLDHSPLTPPRVTPCRCPPQVQDRSHRGVDAARRGHVAWCRAERAGDGPMERVRSHS